MKELGIAKEINVESIQALTWLWNHVCLYKVRLYWLLYLQSP